VLPREDESDHNPLACVLKVEVGPQAPAAAALNDQSVSQPVLVPRWDANKREEFVAALQSSPNWDKISSIRDGLRDNTVDPVAAANELYTLVHQVAVEVFGVTGQPRQCLPSGRRANRWFKHCKVEYEQLRAAIRQGDTHAAQQRKREFKVVERRWKRYYNKQLQERLFDDLRHNPRKFWSAFKGKRASMMQKTMQEVHTYWAQLYGGGGQTLGGTDEEMAQMLQRMARVAGASRGHAAAVGLNTDFTVEEVEAALKKLHSGRAAGPDGLRAEFLKNAYVLIPGNDDRAPPVKEYILAPVLHLLYQALFASGMYVRSWSMATLSAVFKKGDATNLDNYRAIAVGSALGKLYAVLLDARLSRCAETNQWRAEGQAGFRVGKSTTDHVFVLRHLIEATQQGLAATPLYCCFVDFRKAYDKVCREKLVKRLAELGVHGRMLQAIVQMYWSVPLVPKLDGQLGPSISSTCGVKQGDPLSPLLFGLFIDEFEGWLKQRYPNEGVPLHGGKVVQMLLYADDMVLLSRTPSHLQRQLDLLHQFCQSQDMEVNEAKTEIVVFRKPRQQFTTPAGGWKYNGHPITVSEEFRYLGIIFHGTKGISCAVKSLAAAARRAMWAMFSRFKMAGISDLAMKRRLYTSLVMPIMQYCGEVWGPDLLHSCNTLDKLWDNELQRVQSLFLRQLGQLRPTAKTTVVHREFCMDPIAKGWVQASFRLWGRLRAAPADSLLGSAVRGSISLAQNAPLLQRHKCSWAGKFFGMLNSVSQGRTGEQLVRTFTSAWGSNASGTLLAAPESILWQAWNEMVRDPWRAVESMDNPRTAPSNVVRLATYNCWFSTDEVPEQDLDHGYPPGMPRYIRHTGGIPFPHVKQLMRLRTGAHHLEVETGRWSNPPTPRCQRLCTKCSRAVVEDELHFLFQCPAYAGIRQKYAATLFQKFGGVAATASQVARNPRVFRDFMDQEPASQVARFVYECSEYRRNEAVDLLPYFDRNEVGSDYEGQIYDSFSSGVFVQESYGDDSLSDDVESVLALGA